ncbi:hypothetical protein BRW65_07805 [Mycobacterium paraffinicum]|uniref:Uncharacterized protein n=1 Tax=Mycobacterium paraffinicum TaxID=53378 RepID=A0A1Q4HY36_9MYCO|nr:hypothetical protein BRW65_07805 [Mycobacterium paraffinicum]
MADVSTSRADLVCEGGGVRGIGLLGAVDALAQADQEFLRTWSHPDYLAACSGPTKGAPAQGQNPR